MSLVAILRLLLTRVRAGTRVWSGNPSKPDILHNTKIAKHQSAGKVHSVHKHYCSLCQINHRTRLVSHSYLLMHTTISISVTTGPLRHNPFTDCSLRVLFALRLRSVTGCAWQRLCSSLFITRTCDSEVSTWGYIPQQNAYTSITIYSDY